MGPHTDTAEGCQLSQGRHAFHSVIRLGNHEGPLRTAVLRMKKPVGESLAENMGRLFGEFQKERLLAARAAGGTHSASLEAILVPGLHQPPPSPSNWPEPPHPARVTCSVGCDTPHNSYNHQPPRGGECSWGIPSVSGGQKSMENAFCS